MKRRQRREKQMHLDKMEIAMNAFLSGGLSAAATCEATQEEIDAILTGWVMMCHANLGDDAAPRFIAAAVITADRTLGNQEHNPEMAAVVAKLGVFFHKTKINPEINIGDA